jgi:molybdopterin/thiamine biosynthesis adenylyltransferase/rhodanese-related sulfurtransferase
MDVGNTMSRYSRQVSLPEFGAEGQWKLSQARVLVLGAGGLAAPLLQYLVGAGIGGIRLVDLDRVSLDNLHRQTLFTESDIGQPKVEVAQMRMQALNSGVVIDPVVAAADSSNMATLSGGCGLIVDCADSFALSYAASDFCRDAIMPLISASVTGFEGYVGGFCAAAPSLRALFPDLPTEFGSCAEDGVFGPLVGILGAMQAHMVLSVLTGIDPSPLGQLITINGPDLRHGGFRFDGAAEPETGWPFIAASMLERDDTVIDLRSADEAPLITDRASRLAVNDINEDFTPPSSGRVVFCCRGGQRAWQAAERLSTRWHGPIALIAAGTPQPTDTK